MPSPATEPSEKLRTARATLDRDFAAQLEALAAKCDELELKPQAELTRRWFVQRDVRRQFFFPPPKSNGTQPAATAPMIVRQWHDKWMRLRTAHADALFALARSAAADQRAAEAYQLLHETLRENPDHADTRRVLGHTRIGPHWATEAKSAKPQLARFDHPQVGWKRGQYLRAETDHFKISSNANEKAVLELAAQLEDLHTVWRQLFFRFWSDPTSLNARLNGANRPLGNLRQHEVVLFKSREDYVTALGREQPRIAATLGFYSDKQSLSFFFVGDETVRPTWFHEATHQLLQESDVAVADIGARGNVWAIEAAAMYLESLRWEGERERGGYVTLGGVDADRLQFVRYRTLRGDAVPSLDRLVALNRETLQRDPDIAKIYTQAAGWSQFFFDYDGGRYRDPFLDYLATIYAGRDNADSLPSRVNTAWPELEQQFRAFLDVTDDDLAAARVSSAARNLVLGKTSVTDRGFQSLPALSKLELFDIAFTNVTDVGLVAIRPASKLKQLFLEQVAITDKSAEVIASLRGLEELDLSGTKLTDAGLEKLTPLRGLKKLYLTNCAITDRSATTLKTFRQLDTLELTGTQMTPAAQQQIRKALPQLTP